MSKADQSLSDKIVDRLCEQTVNSMAASPDQIEGLKLISEWCKWLITVETAAVGGVGALARDSNGISSSHWVRLGYGFAVASFVCSIVVAAAILSNVPTSVQDMKPGDKIWDRWIYLVNRPICAMHLAGNLLFGLFILGVVSFSGAVLAVISSH